MRSPARTLRILLIGALLAFTASIARGEAAVTSGLRNEDSRHNVLLICVDDLRPALGCYGDRLARTPHIDRLARDGVVFRRAYCQLPSCCPSRTSFLTGLRVETTRVVSNGSPHFREFLPDHITLPQHFKRHGYDCRELGKVFHRRDPVSWSKPKWIPPASYAYPLYGRRETLERQRQIHVTPKPDDWWGHKRWVKVNSWEAPDVPDDALFDGQLAKQAAAVLREPRDGPFFVAVGFFRPHLPFVAPRRYYDLYPLASLRLPANDRPPAAAPEAAWHASPEPRSYTDLPRSGELTRDQQLRLLQGYYASVSYVDAQIGRVLQAVEDLGLRKNTIIVLLSDHGYHLGEHGMWGKKTNFEEATRSVLIVSAPGAAPAATDGLVELVDVYPTLCELGRLPVPKRLEGVSFEPLLRKPQQKWKPGRLQSGGSAAHHGSLDPHRAVSLYRVARRGGSSRRRTLRPRRRSPRPAESGRRAGARVAGARASGPAAGRLAGRTTPAAGDLDSLSVQQQWWNARSEHRPADLDLFDLLRGLLLPGTEGRATIPPRRNNGCPEYHSGGLVSHSLGAVPAPR